MSEQKTCGECEYWLKGLFSSTGMCTHPNRISEEVSREKIPTCGKFEPREDGDER